MKKEDEFKWHPCGVEPDDTEFEALVRYTNGSVEVLHFVRSIDDKDSNNNEIFCWKTKTKIGEQKSYACESYDGAWRPTKLQKTIPIYDSPKQEIMEYYAPKSFCKDITKHAINAFKIKKEQ